MQSLARRLESGGALSCPGVPTAAQPFFTALLRHLFPDRPIVVVTDKQRSWVVATRLQVAFRDSFRTQTPAAGTAPVPGPRTSAVRTRVTAG
ncbi:MAG: hypothetical protein IH623_08235 [Verrucomicrobia bacterium]|nr:hypothetical protein [Verrucomicrobiota bacterium]